MILISTVKKIRHHSRLLHKLSPILIIFKNVKTNLSEKKLKMESENVDFSISF